MRSQRGAAIINNAYVRTALLLSAVMILVVTGTARATTFNVNSTSDLGDDNIGNGICHTSTGVCTLRAALEEVNELGGSHTINVPPGTYDGRFSALKVLTGVNLNIVGEDRTTTVIDLNDSLIRRFEVGGTASISGISITRGRTGGIWVVPGGVLSLSSCIVFSNSDDNSDGGGISVSAGGSLTMDGCTVSLNSARYGGGIEAAGGAAVTITNSKILNNAASYQGGGIILGSDDPSNPHTISNTEISGNHSDLWGGGGLEINGAASIFSSTVKNNYSDGDGTNCGGGIRIGSSATLSVMLSTVQNNWTSSGSGGGICLYGSGSLMLSFSTVDNNEASSVEGDGAGVYAMVGLGTLNINNSTLSNNTAGGRGGGLFVREGSGSVVIQSTFSGNFAAGTGGAIHIGEPQILPSVAIVNSTVTGNGSAVSGGGISVRDGGLYLANVTITLNTADTDGNNDGDGGGIFVDPLAQRQPKIKNSILAGNDDGSTGTFAWFRPDLRGSIESGGYNLIGVSNGGTITGDTTGNLVSADPASPVDPVLGPLEKGIYQTATHALLSGSPAINAGNPAGCTDWDGAAIDVDQRGEIRPQSVICDMGAFEAADVCYNGYKDNGERNTDCGGTCNPCSCGKDPVVILGGAAGTAIGIQEGFTQAQSGAELLVLEYVFNSTDVVLSSFTSKTVTIKGGYDCDFNDNDGYYSTVDGKFEIGQNAAVTIENIVIN